MIFLVDTNDLRCVIKDSYIKFSKSKSFEMEKRNLIINYPCMKYNGGIELYLYNLVKCLIEDGSVHIIWLLELNYDICDSFKDIFEDRRLEIVKVKTSGFTWFKCPSFFLDPNSVNVIVSFTPTNMAMSLLLVERYAKYNIKAYYSLPNTTGNVYFVERFFKGILNKYIKHRMAKIVYKWNQANSILFFSFNHIKPLEDNYSIDVVNKEDKCLPVVTKMPDFNIHVIKEKCKMQTFNIISVSRFDFPHKGYLLGLVEKFGVLCQRYQNLRLLIIGHGPGEEQLKAMIKKLPLNVQDKITLIGQVAYKDIPKYMASAHLNISVAGAVSSGAICGVPSIPARNFCSEGCEVYGLLPESLSKTTSTEKGEDVLPYIEYFINLSEESYINECYNSYNSFKERYSKFNPYYFFEQKSSIHEFNNMGDVRFIKMVTYLYKMSNRLNKII